MNKSWKGIKKHTHTDTHNGTVKKTSEESITKDLRNIFKQRK